MDKDINRIKVVLAEEKEPISVSDRQSFSVILDQSRRKEIRTIILYKWISFKRRTK